MTRNKKPEQMAIRYGSKLKPSIISLWTKEHQIAMR